MYPVFICVIQSDVLARRAGGKSSVIVCLRYFYAEQGDLNILSLELIIDLVGEIHLQNTKMLEEAI